MIKKRKATYLLVFALAFAGCAQSTSSEPVSEAESSSVQESSSETQNGQAPRLLSELTEKAGNDQAAEEAWKALLLESIKSTDYQFNVDTDGEYYLYDENNADTLVTDNFIYEVGNETDFYKNSDQAIDVQLSDVEDSYHALLMGYGRIDRYGTDPIQSAVLLKDTENSTLTGTILQAQTVSNSKTVEEGALEQLMDSLMNFGYIRTVTPFTNSSLYDYSLKQDGNNWVLSLKVKDLDELQKQSDIHALVSDYTGKRPTLITNKIQSETFTFTFDENGVLSKEENNIFHVIAAYQDQYKETYINLMNTTEFEKLDSDDIHPEAFMDYFTGIENGSLQENSDFTIKDWQ